MKTELTSFRFLSDQDVPILAPFFDCRQVQGGETLWHEGDPCDFVAFIVEGKIDLKKETEFAGKQVIVGVYGKGNVVGEMCLLDRTPRAVTAVALEDCSLLLLTRENFDRILQAHPLLGIRLLKGMLLAVSIRLRKSFERLASIF
jgi:CRP-like cAMP-binding protein